MSDPLKGRVKKINSVLKKRYKSARISLDFTTAFQLLVATILSAQCTDERVNKVTPGLFKKYPVVKSFANAPIEELEQDIRSTGFYKNKAKSIKASAAEIVERHGGEAPSTMEELTRLAGVGRKTANVVLGGAFGIPGIAVDTHVSRVGQRLGLTAKKDPVKIEHDLMEIIPKKEWIRISMRIILFGREICQAKKPKCTDCPLSDICEWEGKKGV